MCPFQGRAPVRLFSHTRNIISAAGRSSSFSSTMLTSLVQARSTSSCATRRPPDSGGRGRLLSTHCPLGASRRDDGSPFAGLCCQNDRVGSTELARCIGERAERFGVRPSPDVTAGLVRYLELLARWTRRINLTSLCLEPANDAAVDRLVVEPLIAAAHLQGSERRMLDIGSGAGSPAIPMKLARPDISLTMVEARSRKSAFLREACRVLDLRRAVVETRHFGGVGHTANNIQYDVATMRAVAMDQEIATAIGTSLTESGRVFLFSSSGPSETNFMGNCGSANRFALPSGELSVLIRIALYRSVCE